MQKGNDWKEKAQGFISTCQDELKKTTQIGKKMLSASKINSKLHDSYRELGKLVCKEISEGRLDWDNSDAKALIEKTCECMKELEDMEGAVKDIKKK